MHQIRPATTDDEILRCFSVMRQLRPELRRDDFVATVRRMELEGYRLVFVEDEGEVRGVAGYRLLEMLRTGPMLEVDDLVTDAEARSRGHGAALLDWLFEEARARGCSVVELDSGVQRRDAHRFYHRQGMTILGYHFSIGCGGRG